MDHESFKTEDFCRIIGGASASATAEIAAGTFEQTEGADEALTILHDRFDELVRSIHERVAPSPRGGQLTLIRVMWSRKGPVTEWVASQATTRLQESNHGPHPPQ